jgi:rifampicin phosphotransferase
MARTPGAAPFLVWLDGAGVDRSTVGGKAASLGRLIAMGAPVPKAGVLTTAAWHAFSDAAGLPKRMADVGPDDLPSIRGLLSTAPLPLPIADALASAYLGFEALPDAHVSVAVRSSAVAEDADHHSFAGLHDTVLGVRSHAGLEAAVRQCWASVWSDRAVGYRHRVARDDDETAIAVVIQQMVRPDVSFVLFTVDPITGDSDHAVITASWGLGEAVVSGLVTPDHVVVDADGGVLRYIVGTKEYMMLEDPPPGEGTRQVMVPRAMQAMRALTDGQAAEIAAVGRRLATKLGYAADIEGAVAGGEVWLFQARPITTLQPREPSAAAVDSVVLVWPEGRPKIPE